MFTSIITKLDEAELILDTNAVAVEEQYAAWSDCWNELLIQQIGCFALNRGVAVKECFDGRLWALQFSKLIWFCTEHDPLVTHLTPEHINRQANDSCLLLMPLIKRHFKQKNQELVVEAGQMLLMSQGIPTYSNSLVKQKTLGLVIPLHLLEQGIQQRLEQGMLIIPAQHGLAHALLNLLLTMPQNLIDVTNVLQREKFSEHVLGLLHLCVNEKSTVLECSPQQLQYQSALHEIERHLENPELSCAFVASRLGISESYLYRLFQQRGNQFSHELRIRRLKKVAKALNNPAFKHLSISRIAFHYGFNNASHFSRTFRDSYGCSPSEFRVSAESVKQL